MHAAELLAGASNPIIIAGDGVARAHAVDELTALAELLGARVHGEPVYRRTSFPGNHALWRGGLFPTVPAVRKALEQEPSALVGEDEEPLFVLESEKAAQPIEAMSHGLAERAA